MVAVERIAANVEEQGNNDGEDIFGAVVYGADVEAHEGKERGDFKLARAVGVDVWIRDRDPIDVHCSFLWVRLGDAKILPSEKGREAATRGKLAEVFEDEPLGGDVVADEISLRGHKEEDLVEDNIKNGVEGAFRRRED
ncbi:hypothetical protein ACLOJK_015691 [Asimina triloba]